MTEENNLKQINLNTFYENKYQFVKKAAAFAEDKKLAFALRSCGLIPYELIHSDLKKKIYIRWCDSFKTSLEIIGSKKYNITFNDLTLTKKIINTDLFYYYNIRQLMKLSKYLILYKSNDVWFTHFYCNDNYIRSFYYDNQHYKISPLTLGLKNIKLFNTKYFLGSQELVAFKADFIFDIEKAWMVSLPFTRSFINELNMYDRDFLNYLILD